MNQEIVDFSSKSLGKNAGIDDVLDAFLLVKKSPHTRRAYARDISDLFEQMRVETLSDLAEYDFPIVVDECQRYLKSHTKIDEGTNRVLNATTVNRKAYALSSFFKYLVDVYGYPKNPISQYQAHKTLRRSKTASLTRAELLDVVAHAKKTHRKSQTAFRNYLAVCCMAVLALRREELVGMKWSDINSDSQSIDVYQKGGGTKLLPLPNELYKLLTEYQSIFPPRGDYIFQPVRNNSHGNIDKALSADYIYQMVSKLTKKVLPGKEITPHSLRKTFIELALNNREDFIAIINATGHATVEMVKYYDSRDSLKNNAVNGMSSLI